MIISTLLDKYCDITNLEKTGLLLLDLPTGFGKTYEVLKYIYENYQKSDKKIIFLTELKKNLPHDTTLKNFFKNDNRLDDFYKDIVYINSNVDCVLGNDASKGLLDYIDEIPAFIKETQEFSTLHSNIEFYQNLNKGKKTPLITQLQSKIKNEIQAEYEPKFRKMLTQLFYEKGKKKEDRIHLLKNNIDFQWVAKVYPSSLSFEKKVFFLSVDKFLLKNSPIIEKSYYFLDNNFLKNSLIFIDEFDASKEVVLKNIIETQLKRRIDVIDLFEQIFSSFNSLTIPKIFSKNSKKWQKRKEQKTDLPDIVEIIENLKQETIKINEAYNVSYSIKTYGLNHLRNFLFHDYQYHTIVGDKKSFIYLEQDTEEQINKIHFVEPNNKRLDKPSVTEFLTVIKGFINYFKSCAKLIAENYQHLKEEENPMGEIFTFENALYTFFDELKLHKEQKQYLIDSIQFKQFQNKQRNKESKTKNDFSFYNNGFRYYDFEDSEMHDTKSKIYITDFDRTPEKLLLDLAESNFVVGISATANMQTVIGNYDLKYLRKSLGDNFLQLDNSEIHTLRTEFEKRNQNHVPIKAEFLTVDDWKKTLKNFNFQKIAHNQILTELEKYQNSESQDFEVKRYLKIAKVFQAFICNENIQSFLCFLNTHPDYNKSNCDLKIVELLFTEIIKKHQKEALFLNEKETFDIKQSYRVLNSSNFEEKKEDILETLKTGQKLFLITTYATLGAGQNIQYAIHNFDELLTSGKIKQIYTPQGYPPEKLKDFDAIYLDKPTNLVVNLDDRLDDFGVNKRIFQAEMLFQSRKIFHQQLVYEIKRTFKQAYYKDRRFDIFFPKEVHKSLYSTEDYKNFVAKELIQAIGRINRTHFKNNEVYIFADKEVAPHIKFFDTSNYLCLKEFEKLIEEAQYEIGSEPQNEEGMMEIEQNNIYCHNWINAKIKGKYWNEQNIHDWQELRTIVLKYPTISRQEFENLEILRDWQFIYVPMLDADYKEFEPKCKYHFTQENDYSEVKIDFSGNGKNEVSAKSIHLPELMKIEELKIWFQEQGYASDFKENDYIIAPEIFNNIYKGTLGEVIGKYIFEHYVIPDTTLQELPNEIFERFDFSLDNGVFIDFKFWSDENIQEQQAQIEKIFGLKVPDIQRKGFEFKKVFIINILANNKFDIQPSRNGQLIEVPYLIDLNSFSIDTNIILELHKHLHH